MSTVTIGGVTDQTGGAQRPAVLVGADGRLKIEQGAQVQGTVGGLPVSVGAKGVQPTNRSGTITAGGTAQVLMGANALRTGFWLQNASAGDLWISDVGTAAAASPCIKVVPGALYESPMTGCPTGSLSIFGATTAQAFSAREW